MEAETADEMPAGPEWQYEPKWDGFRCVAFRDRSSVELQSKAGKPLTRYFPEMAAALQRLTAPRFVLDGELVIPEGETLSFESLLLRIHPAASRIRRLSTAQPAHLVVFDLLVDEANHSLVHEPLARRRERLEAFGGRFFPPGSTVHLSPATRDLEVAREWFHSAGGGLDGVIAKHLGSPYTPGQRGAMLKIKRIRTADCVVGGFRYASSGHHVGSLLLGLYNDQGFLDHVGFTSGIRTAERESLTRKLERLVKPPGFTGSAPGGPSRWSTERSSQWEPLVPKLVVEVQYDHFTGGRFRHGTKFCRWRPDKDPSQCTMEQVAKESHSPLILL
jgi:ATP-dependent DNA ligase